MSWESRRTPRRSGDVVRGSSRLAILDRDQWRCQARLDGCLIAATEVDHIHPWFLGGGDEPENLRGICHSCHAKKTGRESLLARRMNQSKAKHSSARLPHPFYRN